MLGSAAHCGPTEIKRMYSEAIDGRRDDNFYSQSQCDVIIAVLQRPTTIINKGRQDLGLSRYMEPKLDSPV